MATATFPESLHAANSKARTRITVSRSAITENRKTGKNLPAWVILTDGRETRCNGADFGTFRLVQEPMANRTGGICYIETDLLPVAP